MRKLWILMGAMGLAAAGVLTAQERESNAADQEPERRLRVGPPESAAQAPLPRPARLRHRHARPGPSGRRLVRRSQLAHLPEFSTVDPRPPIL
jgi:hypothetical protein